MKDLKLYRQEWETQELRANYDEEKYHALSALSAGQIKLLLKSPAHFEAYVDGQDVDVTEAMEFGAAFHKAVLEGPKFRDKYRVMPDFGDFRSSKNRETRDAWLNEQSPGTVVITADQEAQITGMLKSLMGHEKIRNLITGNEGRTEVTGLFNHAGFRCKLRADMFTHQRFVVDLKTTRDASPIRFSQDAWRLRYGVQAAWYLRGISAVLGETLRTFAFVAIEKKPPYVCTLYTADEAILTAGDKLIDVALDRLKRSLDSGKFPGYSEEVSNFLLPAWAVAEIEEMERVGD